MRHRFILRAQKGENLLELVVVLAVAIIVITALVFATISSLRNAQFAKNQAQATELAQEGIERVRLGRDTNAVISDPPDPAIESWDGITSSDQSFWSYHLNDSLNCGATGFACYFKVSETGELTYLGSFPEADFPVALLNLSEKIPTDNPFFHRLVIISDLPLANPSNYQTEKQVTVVVRWQDFSGSRESRLSTYLRNLRD